MDASRCPGGMSPFAKRLSTSPTKVIRKGNFVAPKERDGDLTRSVKPYFDPTNRNALSDKDKISGGSGVGFDVASSPEVSRLGNPLESLSHKQYIEDEQVDRLRMQTSPPMLVNNRSRPRSRMGIPQYLRLANRFTMALKLSRMAAAQLC